MALQICVGASPLISVLALRAFRYVLGIPVGELLGIGHVAITSPLVMAPIALLDGALFPFGCRALLEVSGKEEASARACPYQALGAFLAGLALVVHLLRSLGPVELALVIFLLNLGAVAALRASVPGGAAGRYAGLALVLVTGLTLLTPGPNWLERKSAELFWYEYPPVEARQSVYSHPAVIKEREQYTFFANGMPYAEQDPLVTEQFRRLPTALTERELTEPRLRIRREEGRRFLRTTDARYDAIPMKLPVASRLSLNRYYTVEFFGLAGARLRHRGILALRLPGSETPLSSEMRQLNARIYASLEGL